MDCVMNLINVSIPIIMIVFIVKDKYYTGNVANAEQPCINYNNCEKSTGNTCLKTSDYYTVDLKTHKPVPCKDGDICITSSDDNHNYTENEGTFKIHYKCKDKEHYLPWKDFQCVDKRLNNNNCIKVDVGNIDCIQCDDGTYMKNGDCKAITRYCEVAVSSNVCRKCNPGYIMMR